MKKILLSILFVGMAILANAQRNEVTAAQKAWELLAKNAGKGTLSEDLKILNEGLAHTDAAITDKKTGEAAETWMFRALFSSRIALIDSLDFDNSKAKQKIAEEAIAKANTLKPSDLEKKSISDAQLNVEDAVKNRGIFAYRKKDYAHALEAFNEQTARNPNDTAIYVNAALMAKQLKNYPEVFKNYKKAIELNYPESPLLYKDMINLTLKEVKDSVAGLALLQEASAKFPDDNDFVGMEADYYLKKGDMAKSQEMLTKLIAKNPNNATYQIIMGGMYFKQAADLQEQRNKMDVKKVKEFNDLGDKMMKLLDQALPYYKGAVTADPKNMEALDKLKSIYFFKEDTANVEAITKQIEAIK